MSEISRFFFISDKGFTCAALTLARDNEMSAILAKDLSNLKIKYICFYSTRIGSALISGNYASSGIEIGIGLK